MQIPFVDLKAQYLSIKNELDQAMQAVIDETAFIGGKPLSSFEQQFAELYGVKHCVSVANGTDALYIVLKMLGVGAGDEVITVANSWISSSETISQTGARPVFVDIHPDYYTMNEVLLEGAITSATKAIVPVHLFGQMCDMDAIHAVAAKHNIPVLEDCAQSHFSEWDGVWAGLFGVAGSFSFYPGKNLGAYGDAGCIITNDDGLAEKCKMYARHGALKKHTFHLYVIRTKQRDELMNYLKSKGIQTAVHYPTALPNLPAYDYLGYAKKDFPVASRYQDEILSLPMYPELSVEQITYIAEEIREFINKSRDN